MIRDEEGAEVVWKDDLGEGDDSLMDFEDDEDEVREKVGGFGDVYGDEGLGDGLDGTIGEGGA